MLWMQRLCVTYCNNCEWGLMDQVLDFDTKSLSRPIEIAWCGEDAICLQWRNTGIVMVRPIVV